MNGHAATPPGNPAPRGPRATNEPTPACAPATATDPALALALLEELPSHVAVLDHTGVIVATSGAWRRFQQDNGGSACTCGIGANYLRVCDNASKSSTDAARVARGIRAVVEGDTDRFFHTYECSSPNQRRWFQLRVQAMRFAPHPARPEARLVMVVHQSITESEARAEDRLVRLTEAAHASRLCHIGRTAVELIHEITQPLASVRNYAAGSLRHLNRAPSSSTEAAELREAFEVITKEVARAEEIIRRARAFAARNELVRERFDLADALRDVLTLWGPHLRSLGCEVRPSDSTTPWPASTVIGDRAQIEQILINALSNAADASRQARAIHPDQPDAAHLEVTLSTTDTAVRVEVRDRGPGISPAVKRRLFEPFHTTKPTGLGMGLAISRSIAQAHDGSVTLDNRPDAVGAVFTLELPLAPDLAPAPGAQPADARKENQRHAA